MNTARLARDAAIIERAIAALASYQHVPSVIWELERVLAVIQAEIAEQISNNGNGKL